MKTFGFTLGKYRYNTYVLKAKHVEGRRYGVDKTTGARYLSALGYFVKTVKVLDWKQQ